MGGKKERERLCKIHAQCLCETGGVFVLCSKEHAAIVSVHYLPTINVTSEFNDVHTDRERKTIGTQRPSR